jgi:uncharacterized membrane protein HdeD (DUF308 family)
MSSSATAASTTWPSRSDGRSLLLVRRAIAIVMIVVGGVWIAQGTGALGGSFMTGEALWTVIGLIAALLGASLLVGTFRDRRRGEGDG